MSKQYYFELDNSVFSSEEELIKHIRECYVQVTENKDLELSKLLSKLQKDFPKYEIHIKEGNGWFTDYRIYLKKDGSEIEQYFGNGGRKTYGRGNPSSYEDLTEEIHSKINVVEKILNLVSETYSFNEFKFKNYSYGYSDDENCYTFEFKVSNSVSGVEQFYPYSMTEEKFVRSLEMYFSTSLEGKPSTFWDDGYFEDYTINGVKIGEMMKSKKVRLEVIER